MNATPENSSEDPKKIIIDEDWKEQAEAEKERLSQEQDAAGPEGGPVGELPPASMALLVTQWASQALIGLGEAPHPVTNQPQPDLSQAKLAIDMLEMIDVKTQGNLTPEEKQLLDGVLFEMRMKYVSATR